MSSEPNGQWMGLDNRQSYLVSLVFSGGGLNCQFDTIPFNSLLADKIVVVSPCLD